MADIKVWKCIHVARKGAKRKKLCRPSKNIKGPEWIQVLVAVPNGILKRLETGFCVNSF